VTPVRAALLVYLLSAGTLWGILLPRPRCAFRVPIDERVLSLSPSGQRLVTVGEHRGQYYSPSRLNFWSLHRGQKEQSIWISPDQMFVAAGRRLGETHVPPGSTSDKLTPDGRTLITHGRSGEEAEYSVWDVPTPPPWGRILGWALLPSLASAGVVGWWKSRRADSP
jgi:hypothetical protein